VKKAHRHIRGLVAAMIAVSAIAVPVVAASSANAAVELSFWSWRPEDTAFWTAQTAKFQAATGITVKFTPYVATDYNATLATALTAGKGPDLMQIRAYGGMSALSDAGNFAPLTTKDVPMLAKMAPGTLAGAQGYKDKSQFGIPYSTSVLGVFYNPEILAKAGVAANPTSWASLLSAMDRVKRAGYTALSVGTGYAPGLEQMWAAIAPAFYGGNTFYNSIVAGKTNFNDPAFVRSLKAETELYPYMPAGASGLDYNTQRALFANGKAAFYIGGNYELSYFRSLNPTAPIGWFPAPAATQGGQRYVTNWADGAFAMNAKTPHKAEALKFLNFIASKATMQAGADTLGWIPPVAGIVSTDPVIVAMQRKIPAMGTPFLTLVGFRYGAPTSSSIMQPGFQMVASGAQTVTQLAKSIQDGVATWYAPFTK
jgi:raffinose/stachyose/melibiose transport system substrate-binding protein